MTQPICSVGNESPNAALIQMALAYRRSALLCAAARLGVADALGDEVRDLDFLSKTCQADADALYRLLRALASLGVTEETAPKQFRLTSFGGPLRKDAPQSAWPSVIFYGDLIADSYTWLTDCVRTGRPASDVRDPNVPTRWSQYPDALSVFHAVMGTAPVERLRSYRRSLGLFARERRRRPWRRRGIAHPRRPETQPPSSRHARRCRSQHRSCSIAFCG